MSPLSMRGGAKYIFSPNSDPTSPTRRLQSHVLVHWYATPALGTGTLSVVPGLWRAALIIASKLCSSSMLSLSWL